jgi:hypothetical protein
MRGSQCLEIGVEGGLILLDGEQVVGLFVLDEEAGGFALGMQGIGGDNPAVELKRLEQWLDLGDLVGLRRDLALRDGDALALEEGAQEMDPGAVFAHGTAQALAVDGHGLAGLGQAQEPVAQAGIDARHIGALQDAAKSRLRGRLEACGAGIVASTQAPELAWVRRAAHSAMAV